MELSQRTAHEKTTARISWTSLSPAGRLLTGMATGAIAGVGLYAAMAVAALSQGLGAGYPLHAVQALLSGARVLPDYPRPTLYGAKGLDVVTGPVDFLMPAIGVGAVVSVWAARRLAAGRSRRATTSLVLVPTLVVTVAVFCLTVLLLGYREAPAPVQKISSGYGVRQLGLWAWVIGHLVYASVFVALLDPVARLANAARRRSRGEPVPLRDAAARRGSRASR
jgi:hypothetical protein